MERTFRGVHVSDDRITYREQDHPLLGARATVKTPAALRRDIAAGRTRLTDSAADAVEARTSTNRVFLVVVGDGFAMAIPVPIRKGSDARTFASRLNSAANRLALASPVMPVSQVSTMAERFTVGSTVPMSTMSGGGAGGSSASKYATMGSAPTTSSSHRAGDPTAAQRATGTAGPKASWYPDPTGRYSHRYWDGSRWTEHVGRNGVSAVDPMKATSGRLGLRSSGSPEPPSAGGALLSLFGLDQGR